MALKFSRFRHRWKALWFGFAVPCLILLQTEACIADNPLLLSTSAGPPLSNTSQTGIYDTILKTAFQRIGIAIDIVHLPAERSISNANLGIVDGVFLRVSGLNGIYSGLIQVPEAVIRIEIVAFSKGIQLKPVTWQNLNRYHVAIVRGWKILEENLAEARLLQKVKDQRLLFTLLENNRTDFVVYDRLEGLWVIHSLGLRDISVLEPPLASRDLFLYLHQQHKAHIPAITSALREMKKSGDLKRIITQGSKAIE